ncbi:hypothetical protein M3629_03965 [Paenibacillus polysaccharolyticus]|uniref:DUF7667 family protein n=1 Tax=Paenibacillus polysaccharolyticus TaxID=582692 RepID=UPI00203D7467|nr:hypothetical protein [Paenibacillus polysaccharolyticus]MCM3131924.1 hypothetical protein [Paenibacillus polysaccharolyticus]
MFPYHARIAELWSLNKKRLLTDSELIELDQCMALNAKHCWTLARLQNESLLASMTDDVEWQHETCARMEELQITGKVNY